MVSVGSGGPGWRAWAGRSAMALGVAACLTTWLGPATGLALGMVLALAGLVAWGREARTASKYLIQACVVLLGLRMDLRQVVGAGAGGLVLAASTIVGTFLLAWPLARVLRTGREVTTLVTSGTAICGGSAIAAVGAAIGAGGASMSVAIGAVFLLNALALYLFPLLGHAMGMTPEQFGAWVGVAIHDVSSVVGAAAQFDRIGGVPAGAGSALDSATVTKLSRVIWIVPIAAGAAWMARRALRAGADSGVAPGSGAGPPASSGAKRARGPLGALLARLPVPMFILLFLAASALRTAWPEIGQSEGLIKLTTVRGMTVALFLIGTGLSVAALARVGWRALVLALGLWAGIAGGSLAGIMLLG